jgi:ribose-phosphate pyrophosphokinase
MTKFSNKNIEIISGINNKYFIEKIIKYFKIPEKKYSISKFDDTEIQIIYPKNTLENKDCIIIQSCKATMKKSINDMIMEVIFLINICKQEKCNSITLILPKFPYQRQDKPILMASIEIFENQNIDNIISMDLHNLEIKSFFKNISFINLDSYLVFSEYINKEINTKNLVVISPDLGGVRRVQLLANALNCPFMYCNKYRNTKGDIIKLTFNGNVNNMDCIIYDDIICTGHTVIKTIDILRAKGANKIYLAICHTEFINEDKIIEELKKKCSKVIITNTLDISNKIRNDSLFEILDTSDLFIKTIEELFKL